MPIQVLVYPEGSSVPSAITRMHCIPKVGDKIMVSRGVPQEIIDIVHHVQLAHEASETDHKVHLYVKE